LLPDETVTPAAEGQLPDSPRRTDTDADFRAQERAGAFDFAWEDPTAEDGVPLPEDPAASGMLALTQADCDRQHIQCFRRCWSSKPPWPLNKGDAGHYKYCQSKCLAKYMACLGKAGLLRTFASLEQAKTWLKQHPVLVGTIVVVAGVAYIVSTGGGGALILLPAAA
jgi:hypothetical protein